jgi:ribosomal protein S18 acetylase RimI-like enzyme
VAITYSTTRRPDAGQILRLYAFAPWARHRKAGDVHRMLRYTPLFFSAWDGPALVGMGRAGTDFSFRAVLWDLIVDPAYARKGIGSALVRSFLGHPRLRRVESFWLSTTDKQAFYKKLGFRLNTKNIMVKKRG